jgi:hypothetical protein
MSPSTDVVSISVDLGADSIGVGSKHNAANGVTEHSSSTGSCNLSSIEDKKSAVSSVASPDRGDSEKHWIPLANHVLWEAQKKVKVITIGCGFSGLTLAHKIQHKYKLDDRVEHVIYEKNSDVGGTWFEVS